MDGQRRHLAVFSAAMEDAQAGRPRMFGKYALVAKLAIGGMAEILLARLDGAAGFAKLVCIKRMLPALARDPRLVDMFLAEARIAAQLTHHNICQVFELGEIEGRYFIAMEYLVGVPLSCFRRHDLYPKEPDPRLAVGLAIQACEGLHRAHNHKRPDGSAMEVVHRDVSANNLFVTVDGVVKVLDFGIAKVVQDAGQTKTKTIKGTYAYMAPEQLRGERIDRRTDVFALGVVLWETLARQHLFKRDVDYDTLKAITDDPIPNVCEHRADVSTMLGEVVAKALSRDRNERFASARAFADALANAVGPLGGPLPPFAISEEIALVFEPRLKEQRELIQLAHEGGALDLDVDIGPGIGYGTEMVTTPVSIVTGKSGKSAPRLQSVVTEVMPRNPEGVDDDPVAEAILADQEKTAVNPVRTQTLAVARPRQRVFVIVVCVLILLSALLLIASVAR